MFCFVALWFFLSHFVFDTGFSSIPGRARITILELLICLPLPLKYLHTYVGIATSVTFKCRGNLLLYFHISEVPLLPKAWLTYYPTSVRTIGNDSKVKCIQKSTIVKTEGRMQGVRVKG